MYWRFFKNYFKLMHNNILFFIITLQKITECTLENIDRISSLFIPFHFLNLSYGPIIIGS